MSVVLVAVLFVALAAVVWATMQVVAALKLTREHAAKNRAVQILTFLAPAVSASAQDPRQLLVWQPLAEAARSLCPQEFVELDRASGGRFPFSDEVIQAAHARWSADWLAWELAHDTAFKLKAAEAEAAAGASPALVRSRLDAIDREKLAAYQHRYEEYARVSKGLQALVKPR